MTKGRFVEVLTAAAVPAAYFSYDASLNSKVRPVFDGAEPVALNLAGALARCDAGAVVIDTRDPNDFAAGHLKGSVNVGLAGWYAEFVGGVIEGALLIPLTRLNEQLDALDASKPTVIDCAVAFRSSIAVSRTNAAGFGDVSDLLGGYNAWTAARSAALVS